jgi:predicted ATPase
MARLVSHGQDGHFEIVNQLNRGAPLITSRDERERLAELTLLAGERARASAASVSALTYLTAGVACSRKTRGNAATPET